ncbi:MAG TPA: four helix bundle protein [Chitinophagaceae bacterium]|jgi:hypothetical protein|nr:four helix bundle protein [Chitinophagaceae bacterium]
MTTTSVYKHLTLFSIAKKLVQAAYELVQDIPEEEQELSGKKLKLAALNAYLTIAQGLSRKSRKKLFRKAEMDLLIVDSILELYRDANLLPPDRINDFSYTLIRCMELLRNPIPES